MTPRALLARIEELPPDKRAEVEDFVEFVRLHGSRREAQRTETSQPDQFVVKLRENRERLRREYGTFDSVPILRDLRENGPR